MRAIERGPTGNGNDFRGMDLEGEPQLGLEFAGCPGRRKDRPLRSEGAAAALGGVLVMGICGEPQFRLEVRACLARHEARALRRETATANSILGDSNL
jgi:hypothetical protein